METIDSGKITIFTTLDMSAEVSASDIRPSGLRCLRPPNLELSSAQDQTISWQFIAFQTETESASVSAVLSASVDPYLMKGLISFLYYYYYYYLTDHSSFVKTDSSSSPSTTILTGVPQGSVLVPLLFVLFISPISNVINLDQSNQNNTASFHQYADDTQLYIGTKY